MPPVTLQHNPAASLLHRPPVPCVQWHLVTRQWSLLAHPLVRFLPTRIQRGCVPLQPRRCGHLTHHLAPPRSLYRLNLGPPQLERVLGPQLHPTLPMAVQNPWRRQSPLYGPQRPLSVIATEAKNRLAMSCLRPVTTMFVLFRPLVTRRSRLLPLEG